MYFLVRSLVVAWLILATLETSATSAVGDDAATGSRVLKDLAYVEQGHERQRLDLYLPLAGDRPVPVIVWVHGGGWAGGSKARTPASRMVQSGFAVAAINYRLSQHAVFPAQIHDCKAAIRWLRAHAAEYRLDTRHIGVWGSSAGGHLVALMGTSNGVADLEGTLGNPEQSSDVQAVVDWFGPTDFLTVGPKETRTNLLGGDPLQIPEQAKRASPIHYVSKDDPPFLVMHGDADKTVPIAQSETFTEALQDAGVDATFIKVVGGGHGGQLFTNQESMQRIEAFFRRHLIPAVR